MAQRTIRNGNGTYVVVSKHMTGVPADLVRAIKAIYERRKTTEQRRIRVGDIYTEALVNLMDAFASGQNIVIESPMSGDDGVRVIFFGRKEVIEKFETFCRVLAKKESHVFLTALRLYASSRRGVG